MRYITMIQRQGDTNCRSCLPPSSHRTDASTDDEVSNVYRIGRRENHDQYRASGLHMTVPWFGGRMGIFRARASQKVYLKLENQC